MSSHFQDMNIQELFASGADVVWTDAQKEEMNRHLAKARLKYRKTQMKAQRGGQARYELRKRQLEMKNNHIAQSVDGVQPNDRLDPDQTTNVVDANYRRALKNNNQQQLSTAVSAKAKKNRAKREKQKLKRQAQLKTEQSQTIEVPGTGTDYDTIRLHLDDNNDDEPLVNENDVVLGGANAAVDAQVSTTDDK